MNHEELSDEIIKRICDCGWKAYLCGGAVRDNFIHADPQDYDLVTEATPEDLQMIFPDRKVKTGIGTQFLVTIIDGIDVATYRSDKNTAPGRHNCVTTACRTLEEDLARRDFTFNALAVCPYTGDVVDPFNGRKDLEQKVVKFVGDPNQRIYDDYLRMIRAVRFACLVEGSIEEKSKQAIMDNKNLVSKISSERIRWEILKTMKYKTPSIFFYLLREVGILELILPELEEMFGHPGGYYHCETLFEHSMIAGDVLSPKYPLLRFVGYLHDTGKPLAWTYSKNQNFVNHENIGTDVVERIFQRLKFPTKEIEKAKSLVALHMQSIQEKAKPKSVRRVLNKFSEHHIDWRDWLRLKIADKNANLSNENYSRDDIKNIISKIKYAKESMGVDNNDNRLKVLDINGNDIMKEFNLKPTPTIGVILRNLFEAFMDDPTINEKEKLLNLAREKYSIWVQP